MIRHRFSDESLDPARQEKAREYARIRRRLYFVGLGVGAVALLFLLFSGLSVWLRDRLDFPLPLQAAAYFAILIAAYSALTFPLSFYSGYTLPHRYGLSTQSLRSWLWDQAKGFGLELALGVIVLLVIYWLLATFTAIWWLLAAGAMILFTVILANLAPILIVPLFFKLRPLEDEELARRLKALADRAGQRVRGVYTMDLSSKSTTGNAALMGLGNTRRIVVGDTLFGRYTPNEIEVILAHELGHHVHRDIPKSIVVQSASLLAGFYLVDLALRGLVPPFGFQGIADIAAFPLLALVLGAFSLVIMPLNNAYSRLVEGQADQYALEATQNPEAFITTMTKLTDQNLGEARPSRLVVLIFYSHPPYLDPVARARRYAEGHPGGLRPHPSTP